jgi:hypothetical protein
MQVEMKKLIDMFLTIVYDHYSSMQKRGRRITPWLYTSFLIALLLTILIILIVDIVKQIHLKEAIFLPIFVALYLFLFFLIKWYYFDSGKNLVLLKKYLEEYPAKKRLFLRIIVLTVCCIIPFLLGFVIWLKA